MVSSNGYSNGIVQQTEESASGTGDLNLVSLDQFRDLNDEYSTSGSDVFKYFIRDKSTGEQEFGTGHLVDSSTLARDTVLWSTNSNNIVDFASGVKLITQEPAVNSSGDFVLGASEFQGNISDDQGNTIWDYSAQEIPDASLGSIDNSTLTNSSVTITAGDGLKNGGSVSLGGSTTVDIEPADFAGNALEDDGSDNLAVSSGGINTSEIATGAVSITEASFTDQQLGTGDSPTFSGMTSNGDISMSTNNILNAGKVQFSDAGGDGNNWERTETGGNQLRTNYGGNIKFQIETFNSNSQAAAVLDAGGSNDPLDATDFVKFYGKNGEGHIIDDTGNTTQLSSHDPDGYYYVNHSSPVRGIRQEIDVEKAIKFLEEKFGKDFIREYELEKEAE